ncbi:MAG: hypothetical protein LBI20_01310 [Holosporales bacterium]|jgi:hypothetical protein|nr:hypothetical protein [Holosporales bacterium]
MQTIKTEEWAAHNFAGASIDYQISKRPCPNHYFIAGWPIDLTTHAAIALWEAFLMLQQVHPVKPRIPASDIDPRTNPEIR